MSKKCCLLIVIVFFVAGCTQPNVMQQDIQKPSAVQQDMQQPSQGEWHSMEIPEWELVEGECVFPSINYTELEDIKLIDVNTIQIQGMRYYQCDSPAYTHINLSYGWKIDLSKMVPVGKISLEEVVFSSGDVNSPALLLLNTTTSQAKLFLCEELHNDLKSSLNLDEFIPDVEGKAFGEEDLLHILQIHQDGDSHQNAVPYLDGEWEFYYIQLIHKDCEALRYLIEVSICGDAIFVLDASGNVKVCEHIPQ